MLAVAASAMSASAQEPKSGFADGTTGISVSMQVLCPRLQIRLS